MKPAPNLEHELISLTHSLLLETMEAGQNRAITSDSSLQHHLGLDSMGRAELFRRIEQKWHIQLPDKLLADAETLGDLLKAIPGATLGEGQKDDPSNLALRYAQRRAQKVADVSQASTLVEVLFEHAQATPDRPYIYLQQESGQEEILTYSQLLSNSLRVADALLQRGLKPGDTVAIMQPTQFGFFYSFFGILLAGAVPVPIYPPLRPHQLESYAKHEAKILSNAEIRFLITFEQAETLSKLLKSFVKSLQEVVTIDTLLKDGRNMVLPISAQSDHIAFIQYTSGSTSAPKGVVLTHANLLANIRAFGIAAQLTENDIAVSWLPLYHDFGLIGLVLGTLYYSIPLVLMSPLSFLARPERWLWAIHYHRATISAAPNFAYELCSRKIDSANLAGLDLKSWRMAANGAEIIYAQTYHRFVEKFKPFGFKAEAFLPVYGLAESTVGLAVPPLNRLPVIDTISKRAFEIQRLAVKIAADAENETPLEFFSCGLPLPGHQIRIVDDQFQPVAERVVGQLQFCGPSSMQGYYNNPVATEAIRDGQWWNSGDFAYLADGEVFITGREKDIIIKAGHNIYPSVLEELVSDIPGIRRGCVIAFGSTDAEKGTEKIVIVAECGEKDKVKQAQIREQITETLINVLDTAPDHIVLVPPRTVPKTSSGKLQRSACKSMYESGKLKYAPVWYQLGKLGVKSYGLKFASACVNALKGLYTAYVGLLFLLLGLPSWLAIRCLPQAAGQRLLKGFVKALCFFAGVRIKVTGAHHLTQVQPVIYAANHASYIDAVLAVYLAPTGTRMIAKQEVFSYPFLKDVLTKLDHIPIDRVDFNQGIEQTKQIEQRLLAGQSIFLFPEGTFTYAAGLRPFKLGAFKMAAETNLPLCPIAFNGSRYIMRGNNFLLRPGKIHITVGEPIYPTGNEWQDLIGLKNKAREFIVAHCGELSLDFGV